MTELIDKAHFRELSELDPLDVCRRAVCLYDDTNKFYTVPVWGRLCKIYPHQCKIEYDGGYGTFHPYFDLFTVYYLINAKEIEPANEWISEKDIPGGTTFFRGPHEIPTVLITDRYRDDIEGFKIKSEQLLGSPLHLADAAFTFKITPRIPVAVLYWVGDDEFPAESKILYDKTIIGQLASDILYALAVGICERVGESMK